MTGPADGRKVPLRVLQISQSFFPATGGVSVLLLSLATYLHRYGFDVHVAYINPRSSKEVTGHDEPFVRHEFYLRSNRTIFEGYARFKEVLYQHLHGLMPFPYKDMSEVPGFMEYTEVCKLFGQHLDAILTTLRPDAIHFHDYQLLPSLPRDSRRRTVFSLHAPYLETMNPVVRSWFFDNWLGLHTIVFATESYGMAAVEHGLEEKRIAILPPVILGTRRTAALNTQALQQTEVPQKVISCIQRLDAKSGHMQLVRAFRRVLNQCPEARLWIVAGQSLTDEISDVRASYTLELKAAIEALSMERQVMLMSSINYVELSSVYVRSDVVCMLSKMECFGLAISEAMRWRRPVVVTGVGGLAEQVTNGVNGYVVKVGDVNSTARAILALLSDSGLRRQMGDAGREYYDKRLSPHRVIQRYVRMYKRVSAT